MESHSLNKQNLTIRILNYISTGFALALLALQFLPFWSCFRCLTCGDGKVISIFEYVWFAKNHSEGLTSILQTFYFKDFTAMDVVGSAVLIQLCSIGALILSIARPTKCSTALLPLIAGIAAIVGYLDPVYQLGQNWVIHLVVGIITLVCALTVILFGFFASYKRTQQQVIADMAQ